MKIIHIVNGNDVGGATTQVSALIAAQRLVADVSVIAIGSGKIVTWCQASGIAIEVVPVSVMPLFRLWSKLKTLQKQGCLIHVHGLKPMLLAALATKKHQSTVVATIHSDYYQEYGVKTLKGRIAIPIIKWNISRIPFFITVSDKFAKLLLSDGVSAERCLYIPNGLDLSLVAVTETREQFLARYHVPTDQVICGIAARLHPVKGIDVLINAALPFKGQPVQFLIAGTGDQGLIDSYKEQIEKLGLGDQVHLIGFVEKVYDFYNAIDINMLTSHSEGVSYSVMEAGILEKPVVCTAVSGMQTLIDSGVDGLMVPIGDVDAISEALNHLITNEDQRLAMGRALKAKVNNDYSNHVMAKRYMQFYQKCIEKRS